MDDQVSDLHSDTLRSLVDQIERPDSTLCDCDPHENPPVSPKTGETMPHHCECKAVLVAAELLGSFTQTRHAQQCGQTEPHWDEGYTSPPLVLMAFANRLAEVEADLSAAEAKIERLRWLQIYRPNGRCKLCSGKEGDHQMSCRHYVGPLEHKMHMRGINGSFGGFDYDCICGGWFRQGGLAGHGDGTFDAEVVCPNVTETWRGPREEAEGGTGNQTPSVS